MPLMSVMFSVLRLWRYRTSSRFDMPANHMRVLVIVMPDENDVLTSTFLMSALRAAHPGAVSPEALYSKMITLSSKLP